MFLYNWNFFYSEKDGELRFQRGPKVIWAWRPLLDSQVQHPSPNLKMRRQLKNVLFIHVRVLGAWFLSLETIV